VTSITRSIQVKFNTTYTINTDLTHPYSIFSTELANPQGSAYILRQKQPYSIERAKSVVFNVDEIATSGGDLMRCRGDFAIFEILGAISVIETYSDVELIPIKLYLCFEIKAFDALSSPCFVIKFIKRASDWSRISQTSIVLCNAPLQQLSKTSEIVTG